MKQSAALLTTAILASASIAQAASKGSSWETDFGPMTLQIESDQNITGYYPNYSGRIFADVTDEGTIKATWVQPSAKTRCKEARHGSHYWGQVEWQVLDSEQLLGSWAYCNRELGSGGDWNGTKPSVGAAFATLFGKVIGVAGQMAASQVGLGGVAGHVSNMAIGKATSGLQSAVHDVAYEVDGEVSYTADTTMALIADETVRDPGEEPEYCDRRRSFRPGCSQF